MTRHAVDDMVAVLEKVSAQIKTASPTALIGLMAQMEALQEEMAKLRKIAADDAEPRVDEVH
eukprot:10326799-Karenia_brevis.AAC.1